MPNVQFTQLPGRERVAREVQGDAGRIDNYGESEALGDNYEQTMDVSLEILRIFYWLPPAFTWKVLSFLESDRHYDNRMKSSGLPCASVVG